LLKIEIVCRWKKKFVVILILMLILISILILMLIFEAYDISGDLIWQLITWKVAETCLQQLSQ